MRSTAAALCAAAALAGCGGGGDAITAPPGPPPLPRSFSYDRSQPLHASTKPLSGALGRRTRRAGVDVERVSYDSVDGARVPGLFVRPPNVQPPFPCVIYEGGLGSTKEQAFPLWAPIASVGMGTFTIDARYHGARARRPLEWLRAARDPALLVKMIRGTVFDLRRAVDYLDSRHDCDPQKIGYVGVSLTAIIGTLFSAADQRVQGPVLIVGGGDWTQILRGNSPLLQRVKRNPAKLRAALRALAPFDPIRYVGRISPRPVLMINGRQDITIPPPAARALHAAANQPNRVVWYRGGHSAIFGIAGGQVIDDLTGWLQDQVLSPDPAAGG